jgi:molybdopterin molybdotransferase
MRMPLFSRAKEVPKPAVGSPTPQPMAVPTVSRLTGAPGTDPNGLRGIDEHRDYLLSMIGEMRPFGIGLMEASGLTLCESLTSDLDLPIYTAATVDGWAVRAANLAGGSEMRPVILPIVGEVGAGDLRGAPLTPGTAVKVAVGAPVPEGADAVVPFGYGLVVGDEVEFRVEARFQQNLWLAGSRVADGDRLLGHGALLTPRALGLIAEVGHDKVLARPRPRVALVTASIGLVEPGLPLTRLAERYDSTTTLLAASLRDDGAQVFASGIIPPNPRLVANAVSEQLVRADLLVLVADFTPELLAGMAGLGSFDIADVDGFTHPMAFGLIGPDHIPLLVLPVSPVPAYLAYELFGCPLVERLGGQEISEPELVDGHISSPLEGHPVRTQLVLAHSTSTGVRPLPFIGDQGAAELSDANTVIFVPAGVGALPVGSGVVCWVLD